MSVQLKVAGGIGLQLTGRDVAEFQCTGRCDRCITPLQADNATEAVCIVRQLDVAAVACGEAGVAADVERADLGETGGAGDVERTAGTDGLRVHCRAAQLQVVQPCAGKGAGITQQIEGALRGERQAGLAGVAAVDASDLQAAAVAAHAEQPRDGRGQTEISEHDCAIGGDIAAQVQGPAVAGIEAGQCAVAAHVATEHDNRGPSDGQRVTAVDAAPEVDLARLALQHCVASQFDGALVVLQADAVALHRKFHGIGDRLHAGHIQVRECQRACAADVAVAAAQRDRATKPVDRTTLVVGVVQLDRGAGCNARGPADIQHAAGALAEPAAQRQREIAVQPAVAQDEVACVQLGIGGIQTDLAAEAVAGVGQGDVPASAGLACAEGAGAADRQGSAIAQVGVGGQRQASTDRTTDGGDAVAGLRQIHAALHAQLQRALHGTGCLHHTARVDRDVIGVDVAGQSDSIGGRQIDRSGIDLATGHLDGT